MTRENWSVIPGAIIGRDAELDFAEGFLDEVRGGSTGLVLSGDAVIAKMILWQVGVEQARGHCACACVDVPGSAGRGRAFVRRPVGGAWGAVDSLLPRRRGALEVALLLVEPGAGPPDPLAIGFAVHDLLRAIQRRCSPRSMARSYGSRIRRFRLSGRVRCCVWARFAGRCCRRGAREALEQALAIFEQLGAQLWAAKTQAELARISGRRAGG